MQCSFFRSVRDMAETGTIDDITAIVRGGEDPALAPLIERIRSYPPKSKMTPEQARERANLKRDNLPAAMCSATATQRGDANALAAGNGLVGIDLDDLETYQEAIDARGQIAQSPHVTLAAVSVGGFGVFALVPVDPIPNTKQQFEIAWAAAADHIREVCQMGHNDPSCKNPERLRFATHDPDAHINPNAPPLIIDYDEWMRAQQRQTTARPQTHTNGHSHSNGNGNGRPPTAGDWRSLRGIRDGRWSFTEGQRQTDLMAVLGDMQNLGWPDDTIERAAWEIHGELMGDHETHRVHGALKSVLDYQKGAPPMTYHPTRPTPPAPPQNRQNGHHAPTTEDSETEADIPINAFERDFDGLCQALEHVGVQMKWHTRAGKIVIRTRNPLIAVGDFFNPDPNEFFEGNTQVLDTVRTAMERLCQYPKVYSNGDVNYRPWSVTDSKWKQYVNALVTQPTAAYDPFKDILSSLPPWDETPRLDFLLENLFECPNNTDLPNAEYFEYVRHCSKTIVLAPVWRTFEPGTKHDELLILYGDEGTGKSTLLNSLFTSDWEMRFFSDSVSLSYDSKQIIEETMGRVAVEISELCDMGRTEKNKIRKLLSKRQDSARLAYGRVSIDVPRSFVFFGTANPDNGGVLPIDEFQRRFIPVRVSTHREAGPAGNVQRLREYMDTHRDQLWAEGVHRYNQGEQAHFDHRISTISRTARIEAQADDPWESHLVTIELPTDASDGVHVHQIAAAMGLIRPRPEMYDQMPVGFPPSNVGVYYEIHAFKRSDEMRLSDVLKKRKWTKRQVRRDGTRRQLWFPPPQTATFAAPDMAEIDRQINSD